MRKIAEGTVVQQSAKGTLVVMEVTSAWNVFNEQLLISPVHNTGASWGSQERPPGKHQTAEVERKAMTGPKRRYLPDPGPGHVDFYA
jgi:hypothetical protein